ncbi:hypothetical protein GCM10009634_73730 [Saccharothrix xinjiangensis]
MTISTFSEPPLRLRVDRTRLGAAVSRWPVTRGCDASNEQPEQAVHRGVVIGHTPVGREQVTG